MSLQLVTKSAEVKLMEFIHDLEDPSGWRAIHFHLGALIEQYQSEYQFKIAINLIYDLLRERDGGIYLLSDNGIMVVCYDLEENILNKLIFQLRYLYMDDPLAYTDDGQENPDFCDTFNLFTQWQAFSTVVSKKMARSVRKPVNTPQREPVLTHVAMPQQPALTKELVLSGSSLSRVEQELKRADYSKVWRRQPVCAMGQNNNVRRVFDEVYIHIAHLRRVLEADVDFFSNRWLFKYVTEILDQRMIKLIQMNPSEFFRSPVSFNLNVETLLSSWFADLDSVIPASAKVSVVIEVPVLDAFADITAFMLARDEVQKLGYRLCLDGLNIDSFTQIDRGKLGADLIKLQWNADAATDLQKSRNQKLADSIEAAGSNRVILCRCDDERAVEYGQGLGIALFQGRHLDALVDPNALVTN
ncbi:MAG: hypothetical protein AB7L92_01625 [Alphaproteobacteria bacterium]